MLNQLQAQGSILGAALQSTLLRHSVVTNNIANAEVPGFTASRVDFEGALKQAIGNYPINRSRGEFSLAGFSPTVRLDNTNLTHRLDGNNVDIETEMVKFYQNSMMFDTMVTSIISNSQRMTTVLQFGR